MLGQTGLYSSIVLQDEEKKIKTFIPSDTKINKNRCIKFQQQSYQIIHHFIWLHKKYKTTSQQTWPVASAKLTWLSLK